MPHVRQQIRDAAATLITGTAMPTTGDAVFKSRQRALNVDQLPCWAVFTKNERHVLEERTTGGEMRRDVELRFEGYVRDADGDSANDTLDDMLVELETQIETDRKLGGLLKDLVLDTIEFDGEDDADQVMYAVRVSYIATYWIVRGSPETAI